MTTTVNISLPKEMYQDAKRVVKEKKYASISELVRDGIRKVVYEQDEVWETEEDVHRYFKDLHKRLEERRHGKN